MIFGLLKLEDRRHLEMSNSGQPATNRSIQSKLTLPAETDTLYK